MTELVRYDAMCSAIAACHAIDEVKDLRDKALALQLYAQQAKNTDAERKACEVRLRAERRAGELLQTVDRASGVENLRVGPESPEVTPVATLAQMGISANQSSRWQQLANVPEAEFEAAMADPAEMPSTTRLIRTSRPAYQMMAGEAMWLWNRVREFEQHRIVKFEPLRLLGEMTPGMQADVVRLLPMVAEFFNRCLEEVSNAQLANGRDE